LRYTKCKGLKKDWSVITFGCWQIAPSEGWGNICSPQSADTVVKTALEFGISAFDTAEGYGDGESERRLGKALGHKKQDVIIISKIWPDASLTSVDYHKRLNNSLKALNRDYVDVYLVHCPSTYFNSIEQSEKLCALMEEIKIKPISVALAWVLEQRNILTAIVGSRKPDQVSEFALAGDLRLSAEHLNQLNNASLSFQRK